MKIKPALAVLALARLGVAAIGVGIGARLQAQPATLQISPSPTGTNVNLQWNTGGTLQFAPSILGPWTTVTNGVSVLSSNTMPANGPARFFRVVDNGVAGSPIPLLPNSLSAPLVVQSATLQLFPAAVPAGNTRLVMNIAPGQIASSNVITLLINNQITQLRDDGVFPDQVAGDGNFSAVVNVNMSDLDSLNSEIANLPPNEQITEIFSGRSILGTNVLEAFPTADFFAGAPILFFTNCAFCGFSDPCAGSPLAYDPAKTLMITDLSVVQDTNRTWDPVGGGTKMGAWTFGRLMTDMANTPVTGISASDFVLHWLQSYQFPQTINNDVVPAVTNVQALVVAPWLAASAAEGFPANTLDLSIAPFRLLAVVNRVDLRANTTYGGTAQTNAIPPALGGEARFIFCALDPTGFPLEFTVILEYAVPESTCVGVRSWGAQWAALNSLPFNTPPSNPSFNVALQAITDQFAKANADPSRLPNKSAIHQVRANNFLNTNVNAGWELRQFNIDNGSGGSPGYLVESPVAATPAIALNNSATLNMFILGIPSPSTFCSSGTVPGITIPTVYNSSAFLGGYAPEGLGGMFWDSDTPIALAGSEFCVRHILSLNTCNGCHTAETATGFLQVTPRLFNQTTFLSAFLTGESVSDPDPANSSVIYHYSDLARRVQDLNSLVTCPCFMIVHFFPILSVH